MDNIKSQISEKIKGATNILVTVSSNPSVDQLTACLGLTLWLNKLGKHATAVFSGDIPNALEFLQPEATIEKNTDSLRDFIIALDKSKADKLRYKVEDRVVKIFITPYRTSLSSNDLEFSQGDFNVDAIIALGVVKQEDLDNAIVAHGRILHDATTITINTNSDGGIGSINWHDTTASSLSELIYDLGQTIDITQLDPQIATALLTGIVAETSRFSNSKTTPQTMSVSAALMSAGANQQLVANKLEEAAQKEAVAQEQAAKQENNEQDEADTSPKEEVNKDVAIEQVEEKPKANDGTLEIDHQSDVDNNDPLPTQEELPPSEPQAHEPMVVEQPTMVSEDSPKDEPQESSDNVGVKSNQRLITEAPALGGDLNSSAHYLEQEVEPSIDPLNLPTVDVDQLLNREPLKPITSEEIVDQQALDAALPLNEANESQKRLTKEPSKLEEKQTLEQIEEVVDSPHIDNLRDQVQDALKVGPEPEPEATEALNAVNVDLGNNNKSNDIEFNPSEFELHDHQSEPELDTKDLAPPVPPPIVPPNFLPPSPPK